MLYAATDPLQLVQVQWLSAPVVEAISLYKVMIYPNSSVGYIYLTIPIFLQHNVLKKLD